MRTKLLMLLLTLVWVAGCATPQQSAAPQQSAGPSIASPRLPGLSRMRAFRSRRRRFPRGWGSVGLTAGSATTTSTISFRCEALTLNVDNDRFALSGQQVTLYGNVYHLQHVPDFAGTYKVATPEVTSAVGGSERESRVPEREWRHHPHDREIMCLGPPAWGAGSTCACSRIISPSPSRIFKENRPRHGRWDERPISMGLKPDVPHDGDDGKVKSLSETSTTMLWRRRAAPGRGEPAEAVSDGSEKNHRAVSRKEPGDGQYAAF